MPANITSRIWQQQEQRGYPPGQQTSRGDSSLKHNKNERMPFEPFVHCFTSSALGTEYQRQSGLLLAFLMTAPGDVCPVPYRKFIMSRNIEAREA